MQGEPVPGKEAPGVLVLSEFAGCVQSLSGCVRCNPWSPEDVADGLHTALTLSPQQRQERWGMLNGYVTTFTSRAWASSFVGVMQRVADGKKAAAGGSGDEGAAGSGAQAAGAGRDVGVAAPLPTQVVLATYRSACAPRPFPTSGSKSSGGAAQAGGAYRLLVLRYEGGLVPEGGIRAEEAAAEDAMGGGDDGRSGALASFESRDTRGDTVRAFPSDDALAPPPHLLRILLALCADPHNVVVLVSSRPRADLSRWFGGLPLLRLVAEDGCLVRLPSAATLARGAATTGTPSVPCAVPAAQQQGASATEGAPTNPLDSGPVRPSVFDVFGLPRPRSGVEPGASGVGAGGGVEATVTVGRGPVTTQSERARPPLPRPVATTVSSPSACPSDALAPAVLTAAGPRLGTPAPSPVRPLAMLDGGAAVLTSPRNLRRFSGVGAFSPAAVQPAHHSPLRGDAPASGATRAQPLLSLNGASLMSTASSSSSSSTDASAATAPTQASAAASSAALGPASAVQGDAGAPSSVEWFATTPGVCGARLLPSAPPQQGASMATGVHPDASTSQIERGAPASSSASTGKEGGVDDTSDEVPCNAWLGAVLPLMRHAAERTPGASVEAGDNSAVFSWAHGGKLAQATNQSLTVCSPRSPLHHCHWSFFCYAHHRHPSVCRS